MLRRKSVVTSECCIFVSITLSIATVRINIDKLARTTDESRGSNELLAELREVYDRARGYPDICKQAFHFRRTPSDNSLKEKIRREMGGNFYAQIRHFIGRLSSWEKSARYIVDEYMSTPLLRAERTVHAVDKQIMLPWRHTDRVKNLASMIENSQANGAVQKFFKKDHFVPIVHAEVAMIQHIYSNGLAFANDDRYIGCSKPSCYCCRAYMKLHPLRVKERLSHNNVWHKWSPGPISSKMEGEIVRRMLRKIEADLDQSFNGKMMTVKCRRAFDSQTDLTTAKGTVYTDSVWSSVE